MTITRFKQPADFWQRMDTRQTVMRVLRFVAGLPEAAPYPDFDAEDLKADTEDGARLIGQRASDQLKAIVSRRQSA